MKTAILNLQPEYPDSFTYTFDKSSLEIRKQKFTIEKINKEVYIISDDNDSFFVVWDKPDKRWNSSLEPQLEFPPELIDKSAYFGLYEFISLNCLHIALKNNAEQTIYDAFEKLSQYRGQTNV